MQHEAAPLVADRRRLPGLSAHASPMPTAMAPATSPASPAASTTSPGWASTPSGSRRSTHRRWPTSATTSPTTPMSTRCSDRWTTSMRCSPRPTTAASGSSSTTCRTTPVTSTRGSSSRARRATATGATGTSGATRSPTAACRTTGSACSPGQPGSGTRRREQYYLHTFLPEQPDLNWRNPDMRAAMFDVARFWLDRGVDGFRIDVAPMVMKDPELRDNPPNPDPSEWTPARASWPTQLHINDHDHPDMHELYRDFRRLLESYPGDRVSIGELHHPDYDTWAKYYGERQDEIHVPFNFHLTYSPWTRRGGARRRRGRAGRPAAGRVGELGARQPRPATLRVAASRGPRPGKGRDAAAAHPARHAHDLLRRGDRHGRRAGGDRRFARPARAPRARPRPRSGALADAVGRLPERRASRAPDATPWLPLAPDADA